MGEDISIDAYLTKIKDLNKLSIPMDEIIAQSSLMQTVRDGLLDSYLNTASTLRLMMKGNLKTLTLDELVVVLLQEEKS